MTLKQVVRSAISDKYLPAGSYDDIFKDVSVKRNVDFKAHTVTINKAVELPDNGETKTKTTKKTARSGRSYT